MCVNPSASSSIYFTSQSAINCCTGVLGDWLVWWVSDVGDVGDVVVGGVAGVGDVVVGGVAGVAGVVVSGWLVV